MLKRWKNILFRVFRSYSIEEKVISVIVAGIVFFMLAQTGLGLFRISGRVEQESGNIYNEAFVSERPVVLNPLYVDFHEASRDISSLVFSGLVKYDPQKKGFVDDLAILSISADRKTYRFTLKDKLKWHDGFSITAEDVYFTFHELVQHPKFQNPILKLNFEGVNIVMVDQKTIEFRLKKPNAFFVTNLNIGIVPKHLLGNVPVEQLPSNIFNVKPVGSGPYKIDAPLELQKDGIQRVTLKTYEDYYGQRPKIKQIRFSVYPVVEMLLDQLATLNVIAKMPLSSTEFIQKKKRFSLIPYELPQYTAIFFNLQHPLLKKEKIRLALLKSIDKQALLVDFKDKLAVDTPLLELQQSEWIYKPNLTEAKGALFDSGFKQKPGGDGYRRDSNGKPLKFTLLIRSHEEGTPQFEEMKKLTDFLIKSWKSIGVELKIEAVNEDEFKQQLQAKKYDMVLAGQGLGYNFDTYAYWHSSQTTDTGLNLSNYKSFAANQLIEEIRDTFDSKEKDKKLKDLAKILAKDIPAIFLYRPRYTFVTDGKIGGISLKNMAFPSDRFANIASWY